MRAGLRLFVEGWPVSWEIREGDALARLREMPDESVHCVVTSPPYWGLRDYGVAGQLGLERTPEEYTTALVGVFAEVRRVLRDDGTLWLNLGDSYAGAAAGGDMRLSDKTTIGRTHNGEGEPHFGASRTLPRSAKRVPPGLKPKDLVGVPWAVAFALRADGWWLRSDIIWAKSNPMPESVRDRPTKAHEYLFLLTKAERYFYDADAVAEESTPDMKRRAAAGHTRGNGTRDPSRGDAATLVGGVVTADGRNRRSVWTIATAPFPEAHFATFPPELPELCIKAGCPEGGTVLDPFAGAGTTGLVATRLGRNFIGIELNPTYAALARNRIDADCPLFNRSSGGTS